MPSAPPDPDPRPLPPNRPDIDDCCKGGCEVCVFDFYEEEMERYRAEVGAWEKRGREKKGKAATASR